MRHQHTKAFSRTAFAAIAMTALSLAACGSSSGGTGSSGGSKTVYIATELAVSGTDASEQLPAQYGVDLAASKNTDLGGGYTLKVLHDNYEGSGGPDNSIGTADAQKLVANSSVMAVVGPFNSGIAEVMLPATQAAGLPMISATNTNPGLTKSQYAPSQGINFSLLHPAGKSNAYFRVCGTDDVQGKVDAQIASTAPISAHTVYVVDDNTVYGKGLANYFVTNFKASGGTVVGRTSITAQQVSNVSQFADTIKAANPDVVFYGGVTSGGGGALKLALTQKGYTKPMVGGDGIADDPGWVKTAGSGASNTYGTVAAPDISSLTSGPAATFSSEYKAYVASKPSNDLTPYSAMSYDSAMIEIQAIKSVIKAGKAVTRANVRDAIAGISYDGVTGHIAFDSNGDNSGQKVFSVYYIAPSANKWSFKKQVNA